MHQIAIPQWVLDRAMRFSAIDPARTALLVIDLQNGFVCEDGVLHIPMAREILPQVNRLIAAFRQAGSQIVFVRQIYATDPAERPDPARRPDNFPRGEATRLQIGTYDHAVHAALDRDELDLIIDKTRYSAMLPGSSTLHQELQDRGIDTVVICGAATNVCCETTARDAAMMDYRVFFASDATATHHEAFHNAALINLMMIFADVRAHTELIALLGPPGLGAHADQADAPAS